MDHPSRSDAPGGSSAVVEPPALPRTALRPKSLTAFRGYTREAFRNDLLAGVLVGIVALPLAIAFSIASGVSPDRGLVTAVVAGFLISALSGSRVQIGGPTGAFVVIVHGIVKDHGVDGLMVATLMAGVILVVMGLAGFGSLIRFVPHPVTVGFTSGIAVIILSGQVGDLLGLRVADAPAGFFARWAAYARAAAGGVDPWSAGLGLGSAALVALWPRVSRKVPGSLVALVLGTAAVQAFGLPVETIGSRFGEIPSSLPVPSLPDVDWGAIDDLAGPALTIALLAAIESLLCATVSDGMIGGRHRSNMELVAQGAANIASPLFGGIPATGAIARTATNVKNGGRTPAAGMIHAFTLLLLMLVLGRWASLVPLAVLAAILVVVAYNMSEWRTFRALLRSPRGDVGVLLLTFGLTVAVDLTVAIEAGMLASALLFMKTMSESVRVGPAGGRVGDLSRALRDERAPEAEPEVRAKGRLPSGVEVFDVQGPLFFGAAQRFEETLQVAGPPPRAMIVDLKEVGHIDATGIHALEQLARRCRRAGTRMVLAGLRAQPMEALARSGLAGELGEDGIAPTVEAALARSAGDGAPSA